MNITSFDDLLAAALTQQRPQRLLLVFAGIELPDEASPEERVAFEQGHGGALVPRMCVDKLPEEIASFEHLKSEASQSGMAWGVVFAAALEGEMGRPMTSGDIEKALKNMVEDIRHGNLGAFIPFNHRGEALQLGRNG